jgi:hypothetical protein
MLRQHDKFRFQRTKTWFDILPGFKDQFIRKAGKTNSLMSLSTTFTRCMARVSGVLHGDWSYNMQLMIIIHKGQHTTSSGYAKSEKTCSNLLRDYTFLYYGQSASITIFNIRKTWQSFNIWIWTVNKGDSIYTQEH